MKGMQLGKILLLSKIRHRMSIRNPVFRKYTPIVSLLYLLKAKKRGKNKVSADKAAKNVVVVCRLHYINTLKQELNGTKAYEETSIDEKSVVYSHSNKIPKKFAVDVKERQDRLPTMYWLPKLHKRPYKAKFIANSSSCTTTEL